MTGSRVFQSRPGIVCSAPGGAEGEHVLLNLTAGVIVHIDDMFWPFEYRDDWLMRPTGTLTRASAAAIHGRAGTLFSDRFAWDR